MVLKTSLFKIGNKLPQKTCTYSGPVTGRGGRKYPLSTMPSQLSWQSAFLVRMRSPVQIWLAALGAIPLPKNSRRTKPGGKKSVTQHRCITLDPGRLRLQVWENCVKCMSPYVSASCADVSLQLIKIAEVWCGRPREWNPKFTICPFSSAGRALPLQGRCRRFKSVSGYQIL